MKKIFFGVALAAAAVSAPVVAHHSAAMFDHDIEVTMTGTVTKFDYVNPHSWLYIDVEDEDGNVVEWGFELDAPPRLRRLGVSPNFWQEGDRITVKTHPLKDGRPAGALAGAINANGDTFGDASGLAAPGH